MTSPPPHELLEDARWLRKLLSQSIRDPYCVEDLYQETYLKTHRHPLGQDRSFVAQVARNVARSFLRRERTRTRAESRLVAAPHSVSTAHLVAEAELQRAAVDALLALEDPYRETLLLRFMKGLSLRSTAAEMRVPVETVRTRQKRALEQLRRRLEPQKPQRAVVVPAPISYSRPVSTFLGLLLMKTKLTMIGCALFTVAALWMGGLFSTPSPEDGVSVARPMASAETRVQPPRQVPEGEPSRVREPARLPAIPASPDGGALTVRVRYERDGQSAANVGVRISEPGVRQPRLSTTDGKGEVHFRRVRAGSVEVSLTQSVYESVTIQNGARSIVDLTIPPGRNVHGLVTDAMNQPIPNAEVMVVRGAVRPQWLQTLTTTDSAGRFSLRDMHRFNMIGARAKGFATSDFFLVQTSPRRPDHSATIRLVLPSAAAELHGTVQRPDGSPARNVWVKVGYDSRGVDKARRTAPPYRHLRTDDQGRFRATHLQPGDVQVRIHPSDAAEWRGDFPCVAGQVREVRIKLVRGTTLRGRVLDPAGRPLAGIHITRQGAEYPTKSDHRSGEAGHFELRNLPSGTTAIEISDGSERCLSIVEIPPVQLFEHDLRFVKQRSILGQLVDSHHQPRVGWWVGAVGLNRRARTDKDGKFQLVNCENRAYRLVIFEKPGFVPVIRQFPDVRPTSERRIYVVPKEDLPRAKIHGRIFAADNRPLEGVEIALYQFPGRHLVPVARSDSEGRFETSKLPAGRFTVSLAHPNHKPHRIREIELANGERKDLGRISLRAK